MRGANANLVARSLQGGLRLRESGSEERPVIGLRGSLPIAQYVQDYSLQADGMPTLSKTPVQSGLQGFYN